MRNSAFFYWAVAHGISYAPGHFMRYKLIVRKSVIDKMIYEWHRDVIWG